MKNSCRIALGGGCHWCTEAVYQFLKGVSRVEQGFVASEDTDATFSEAIIVHYDANQISLEDLILIHLHTHRSTSMHSMRNKYRSAIYTFDAVTAEKSTQALQNFQERFNGLLVTKVLPFIEFMESDKKFHNYYYSNRQKPFCNTYITPKLNLLLEKFADHMDVTKLLGQ